MRDEKIADNLAVDITYKNKNMETVSTKTYEFKDYMSMIGLDIRRVIMDVEDLVYRLQDGKQKDEWSDQAIAGFSRIRHKLLDKAGEVDRVADSLRRMERNENVGQAGRVGTQEFETIEDFVKNIFGA
jgi:hypothetical protein